jgi:hypothetical protein
MTSFRNGGLLRVVRYGHTPRYQTPAEVGTRPTEPSRVWIRLYSARKSVSARIGIKVGHRADPNIQMHIQRAIDDAREYSMRLH